MTLDFRVDALSLLAAQGEVVLRDGVLVREDLRDQSHDACADAGLVAENAIRSRARRVKISGVHGVFLDVGCEGAGLVRILGGPASPGREPYAAVLQ